jgi:hypothetical protein
MFVPATCALGILSPYPCDGVATLNLINFLPSVPIGTLSRFAICQRRTACVYIDAFHVLHAFAITVRDKKQGPQLWSRAG